MLRFVDYDRMNNSFFFQSRRERQKRLRLLIRLSVEYVIYAKYSNYGLRTLECLIESIIDGDYEDLKGFISDIKNDKEFKNIESFLKIAEEALEGH